jgi:hypothetical protein
MKVFPLYYFLTGSITGPVSSSRNYEH